MMSLAACSRGYKYSRYHSIGSNGWERNEEIIFTPPAVSTSANYEEMLGLRTNSSYPFTQLTLIVTQQARPSGYTRCDTLEARLTDDDGLVTGHGIVHYHYLLPLPAATLAQGDTLRVSLRHDMLRSPLHGVADVGFLLKETPVK